MPKVKFLPSGVVCDVKAGESILDIALSHGVPIQHACGGFCACTTCHVIVKEGYQSLNPPDENEEDMLDRAWGLNPQSRLSCQAIVAKEDLVIEIPKYSINHAKENH